MTADAISELEQLLREEREAIRRVDAAAVLSFAERKEALVASLQANGQLTAEAAKRFAALVPALRHNSVLLAHARDVLRDAIAVTRARVGPTTNGTPAAPPRLISVRG